jgi:TusA-related sulfurtransferase
MSCHESSSDPLGRLLPGMFARGFDRAWLKVSVIPAAQANDYGADLRLDFLGQTCLRTNLMIKRVLVSMRPGLVIEIVSDNLSVVETIPFMLPGYDCVHLATVHLDDRWKIFAKKAGT